MKVLHLTADRNKIDREEYYKIIIDVKMETVKNVLAGKIEHTSYVHVANVEGDNLDDAFRLTNNIDWHWSENEGVEAIVKDCRSTSVGDIIVKDNGDMFLVANFGFTEIK